MQIEIHCHTHALLQATAARTAFELSSPAKPLLLPQNLSGAFEGAAALLAWYQARFQMNERGSYPDKQCISIHSNYHLNLHVLGLILRVVRMQM